MGTNSNSVYPIHSNSVNTLSGVLQDWVQQPCDESPGIDGTVPVYREKFKGPYSKGLLLADETGITLEKFHAKLGDYNHFYEAPECPMINGVVYIWVVSSVRVEELEAGDHCILDVEYKADMQVNSGSGQGSWNPKADTWNLSWQTYTLSPFNFCQNGVVSANVWPEDGQLALDWTKPADRGLIETALHARDHQIVIYNNTKIVTYWPDKLNNPEEQYWLDPANTPIYEKYLLQRNCLWHYPVITHTREYRTYLSSYGETITDIDHVIDYGLLPSGCPYSKVLYSTEKDWQWVKSGQDMNQTKVYENGLWKNTFTVKESWNGYPPEVDVNFYGNQTFTHDQTGILSGRWEVQSI